MYAIVELQWHQYIVQAWSTLIVDRLSDETAEQLTCEKVLWVFTNEGLTHLWAPYISWASVIFDVVSHQKWEKIRVVKFHRKNRYERNLWFRPYQSTLKVVSINQ